MKPYKYQSLKASEYKTSKWLNGLGKTSELWKSPFDADLTSFDWRVSIATIENSNHFSTFQNYDRSITQLDGGKLNLFDENAQLIYQLKIFEPYFFKGDQKICCELTLPVARDFNVITRSQLLAQKVQCLLFSEANLSRLILVEDICFIYVVKGSCKIFENEIILENNSALITGEMVEVTVRVQYPETILMVVTIKAKLKTEKVQIEHENKFIDA